MSGIFPPADKGGVPPGGNVCNGFSPTNHVIGEGPRYIAADCTTVLTDCQLNSIVSELLALADGFGYAWNADRVDNLAQALLDVVAEINRNIATRVIRSGDTMEGVLNLFRDPQNDPEAATKRYVDNQDAALNTALRTYIGTVNAATNAAWQAVTAAIDERKINRAGDVMTGPLALAANPLEPLEAATKQYVDEQTQVAPGPPGGDGGGGGGIPEAPFTGIWGRSGGQWVLLIDDGEY